MNKTITSREAILSAGKEIIVQSGIQGLNMRDVARKCGVSVGSVYNYFPSKGDLIIATIESVWTEIMHGSTGCVPQHNFAENILSLFNSVQKGRKKYPSFFTVHSMSVANLDKNKGREAMNRYFAHIKNGLLESLQRDQGIRKDAFSNQFTKPDFVDFIFSNIITLLMKEATSCDLLLEIVKRTIY
ncbi:MULTISPECIES: TetR/AcrR family transcriptional regulator [unclassified Sedimentibacter]|uniref:TetR/AcrR family transcriptional regulator n=1 Tax=unclassified Sedimentibacter TaxID=2649220 RepID=UPI0027E00F3A|nr:TetR/AcrR family transcriptional regulator [Sedimentibacter sp. MB35-C1]WMJ77116.1 TetR/AcrR family transcriptional regulator [Sedimentibacter sp. MB35-C1]